MKAEKMKKYWMILYLMLTGLSLPAQNFVRDVEKIQMAYRKAGAMELHMDVMHYDDQGRALPDSGRKLRMKKLGRLLHYSTEGVEMLFGDRELLWVHHPSRSINVQPRMADMEPPATMPLSLDSLLRVHGANVAYLGTKEGLKHYRSRQEEGPIAHADIYLHARTGLYHKVVYHFRDTPQNASYTQEMHFPLMDFNAPLTKEHFTTAHYFTEKKGKQVPTETYRDYRINTME